MSAFAPQKAKEPTSAADIGDAYIEGRSHCDEGGEGCFLTTTQRDRLINSIGDRIGDASDAAYAALGAVGLKEALKKDEDVDVFQSIMIGGIGAVLGTAIKLGGAAAGKRSLAAFGVTSPEAISALAATDDSALGYMTKTAVDSAKAGAKGAVTDDTEHDRQQTATGDFVAALGARLGIAFQMQREGPPSWATDAQLIKLWESWHQRYHGMDRYTAEFAKVVARFKSSTASKIGRTDRAIHGESVAELAAKQDVGGMVRKAGDSKLRDTKLVLQTYADGTAADLMYYARDYELPLTARGAHDHEPDLEPFAVNDWHVVSRVEDDFALAAQSANLAKWGVEYEVKPMSDRAKAPADFVPKPKSIVSTDDESTSPLSMPQPIVSTK